MKALVRNVYRLWGVSPKTGNEFDMHRLTLETAVENRVGKVSYHGYGVTEMEIALDPAALPQFAKLSFPIELELLTDVAPVMGKLETVVTGFKVLQAQPKAA